jgi:hypothetical protein
MKKIFLLAVFAVTLVLGTCSENPVSNDDLKPGRRDYVWTVDTLNTPFNIYYRMWGSSPTDVWCVSPGDWDKSISHFDAENWSSYGVAGIIVPNAIYGFSSNDVFIGTENGKIWQFDGSNWTLFVELKKSENDWIIIENIWGESLSNFFAFGAYIDNNGSPNSLVANYKNYNWSILNTDMLTGIVERLYLNKSDNKVYLRTNRLGGGEYYDSTLIYEYVQGKYNELYSSVDTRGQQADISLINNEVYFILGNEIAKRKDNQFQIFLQVTNPNFYQRIWGRNNKDIFLFMTNGLVHYNGSDQEYLLHFDKLRTQIFGAVLFENEVFFLVYESETHLNLIFHGKLNE